LIDEVCTSIRSNTQLEDSNLIDHLNVIAKEMHCTEKVTSIYEEIHKKSPKDMDCAINLFNSYCRFNDFFKMNMLASKIEKTFNKSEFALNSSESLYLFSLEKTAPPKTIDLSFMTVEKYRKTSGNDIAVDYNFANLYIKILIEKKAY
jgi:exonuclease I